MRSSIDELWVNGVDELKKASFCKCQSCEGLGYYYGIDGIDIHTCNHCNGYGVVDSNEKSVDDVLKDAKDSIFRMTLKYREPLCKEVERTISLNRKRYYEMIADGVMNKILTDDDSELEIPCLGDDIDQNLLRIYALEIFRKIFVRIGNYGNKTYYIRISKY